MRNTAEIINFERPVVKADIESGYDRLAHDITDAFTKNPAKLSGCEFQIIFAIIGKTYRWQKKSDWVANSQLCEKTGMLKGHVSKVIKSLITKNVIVKNGREIGLNSIVSEWGIAQESPKVTQSGNNRKLPNQITEVTQLETKVTQSDNNSYPIAPPQKKKETNTKETNTKEKGVNKKSPKNAIPFVEIPEYVNRELFDNYLSVRINKKYNLSENALNLLVSKIKTIHAKGHDVNSIIENAILGEWKSIYEPNTPAKNNFQPKGRVQPENFAQKDYGQSTFTGDF